MAPKTDKSSSGAGAGSGSGSSSPRFPYNMLHLGLLALVLALALHRHVLGDAGDRHHCRALLNEGRWLESAHQVWQPDGCMLHPYKPKEVTQCFADRHVVFIGDSTVRQVYCGLILCKTFPPEADKSIDTTAEKHSDRVLTVNGVTYSFYWDPFLNSTRFTQLVGGTLASNVGGVTPTLAVIGSGIWYLRHPDSGGFDKWSQRMDALFLGLDPERAAKIADAVILMPVENALESKLSPERAATVHLDDINQMNSVLDKKLHERAAVQKTYSMRPTLAIPRVFNKVIAGLDEETDDGLHFSDAVVKVQATILLNMRCNDVLPKKFPFDKTCCNSYPTPNWVQILVLAICMGWGPIGLYMQWKSDIHPSALRFFPEAKFLVPLSIFGLSIGLLFLADRTGLFLKENKQYDSLTFGLLCAASVVAGVLTMKPAEKDLGFLNRDQTDEWKGWMQIAILIYHYLGASKISGIYNPIRVLVAAYLFMSGYGHLSFFLKKADYAFARVANILIRLNLLTVVLSYLMDTDYLSYYFSPLVTIWFGIIWVTMWIGHQHNDKPAFLVSKLVVAAGLTAAYFEIEGPLEATFTIINTIFATAWNAKEWRFRVTLDMWIVWIGMFTAYAFILIKDNRLMEHPSWAKWQRSAIIGSAISMVGYFVYEMSRANKFVYNASHPYVSALPVLAFVVLRNATPSLRSTSSKFFIFFGQCSLETFIIQFHFFIAGDTRGIIMMIPGGPLLRPINFTVTSIIFVYISNQVATATGSLTSWICAPAANPNAGRLPIANLSASVPATARAPAGAPSEYVALATVGESFEVDEKDPPILTPPPAPETVVTKFGNYVKTDLKLRFLAIIVGLWFLNELYPS
ncbi:BZ3500_MvSof-1268-A1-R1_Chr8-2g10181 [Microbotryum saponariae]|uniref:BZ3500_MvSof-1268-A1-R1_Chr8-2g10181 protein n=1 Tax=Microbotryum saponariae TaxID=289078 RepID=A0A2X0LB75_9BASI|nr:BZ3500_MvSof-1268-A1-R1_Chr8-2g10181 [Microbotryum saponariae]SDA01948.1 BZ3501_MvSof-1269-A2-R1_Chr8-2g09931 [Microbotryum saponariae]